MKYFIYRIFNEDESLGAYIGKTNNLKLRINNHRHDCKTQKQIPAYSVINANGGYDNWKTEVIEEIETEDLKVVREREQYWIENTPNKLNKKNEKPFDLNAYMAKWYEKNRDKKKEYYQANREKRLAYQRAYVEKKKSNNNINDCANNEIPSQD